MKCEMMKIYLTALNHSSSRENMNVKSPFHPQKQQQLINYDDDLNDFFLSSFLL
jgi:hypothetical protein